MIRILLSGPSRKERKDLVINNEMNEIAELAAESGGTTKPTSVLNEKRMKEKPDKQVGKRKERGEGKSERGRGGE